MLHNPGTIPLPIYNMTRHPIETWQEWYIKNQTVIDIQVHITNQVEMYGASVVDDPSFDIRNIAPYEYIDSLNLRQIWEPFLTGRERQEFDTHLRVNIIYHFIFFYYFYFISQIFFIVYFLPLALTLVRFVSINVWMKKSIKLVTSVFSRYLYLK